MNDHPGPEEQAIAETAATCIPMLNVCDAAKSIAFYKAAMGFVLVDEVVREGEDFHWALMRKGHQRLMINQRREAASQQRREGEPFRSVVFYYGVENVFAFAQEMLDRGYNVTKPQLQEYGMNECYLRDPDGYELAFTGPPEA